MAEDEKIVVVSGDTEVIEKCAYRGGRMEEVVILDGVKKIEERAFSCCGNLKRIYIPASVEVIEDDAFYLCLDLEIYCEKKPQKGWIRGKQTVRVYYEEPDGFNFHRSSGGWIDRPIRREEVVHNNYNPHERPVHTNVSREEFEKLQRDE